MRGVPTKNLEVLLYLVQELETVTFERQRQYSSLFGRLEADECKVCELQQYNDRAPPPSRLPSRLPDVTHVTLSPRPSPSVFAYCASDQDCGDTAETVRKDYGVVTMRKDCGDAAETVRKDYGSSADIVWTKCGATAVPLLLAVVVNKSVDS